jgi:thiol-disulfide isomerase/thioredoxin
MVPVRRRTSIVAVVLGAAAVAGIVVWGHAQESTVSKQKAVVELTPGFKRFEAPAIAGRTLTGGRFSLASLRGRVVVVNFWASWCAACRAEAPQMAKVARAERDVAFVGVDVTDHSGAALRFARAHGWRYPLVPDDHGDLLPPYGVIGMPTTVLVDRRGVVVDKWTGATTAAVLEAKLRAAERA